MLSAVAARRARAAAANAQSNDSNNQLESAPPTAAESLNSTHEAAELENTDDNRKRRASNSVLESSNSNRKRQKSADVNSAASGNGMPADLRRTGKEVSAKPASSSKGKGKPPKKQKKKRYFDENLNEPTAFGNCGRDEEASPSSSEDELFGFHLMNEESEGARTNGRTTPGTSGRVRRQRAWSPSNPLQDSDSSSVENETIELDEVPAPPIPGQSLIPPPDTPLSTWTPTSSNCHKIPTDSSGTSKLLLLRAGDTITLLGVFALDVLKGDVEYQGVKLSPSLRKIEVFAPKCSPLSAIRALPPDPLNAEESSLGQNLLPSNLKEVVDAHEGAVFIVSALRTGIEGLGRVCSTFESIFSPPRGYEGTTSLGIEGVVMVNFKYSYCFDRVAHTLPPGEGPPSTSTTFHRPPIMATYFRVVHVHGPE